MKQHAFDATSFIFGIVLGAAGIGFLLAEQYDWDVDGRWVLPAALIALGVAGIVGAISGLVPRRQSDTADAEADADADELDDDVSDHDPSMTNDDRGAIRKQ
jgi:hypothetical protein